MYDYLPLPQGAFTLQEKVVLPVDIHNLILVVVKLIASWKQISKHLCVHLYKDLLFPTELLSEIAIFNHTFQFFQ
jgi:hypothetical protein